MSQDPALPKYEIPITEDGKKTSKNWYFFFSQLLNSITGGVTKIIAGTNVTISPTSGVGDVTINATGGGGSGTVSDITSTGGSITVTNPTGPTVNIEVTTPGGTGTVTSVALSDASTNPIYTVTGSPVTTTGTLTETLKTQTANTVFAGPTTGAAAQPTFRALGSTDIPFGPANITPDTHPNPELSVNDEFEFGSALDTTGGRFSGASPWAWSRQGNSTTGVSEGSLLFQGDWNGSGALTCFFQPITGTTWAYTAKMALANCFLQNNGPGLYVCNSGTGKILKHGFYSASASACTEDCYEYSGTGVGGQGTPLSSGTGVVAPPILTRLAATLAKTYGGFWTYLQISYDGTNINGSFSSTGVPGTFQNFWQQTPATFLGGVPDQVGLAIPTSNQFNSSQVQWLICDWFRKTA